MGWSNSGRSGTSPRLYSPGLCHTSTLMEGAGNAGRSVRARGLACKIKKHTSVVTTVTPVSPGIPRAAGFNGLFQALPGDRAFLSPSPAQCASIVASLISASRYQDHMASPSARSCVRLAQISVHRIPKPTLSDDRETPLSKGTGRAETCPRFARRHKRIACDTMARRANHLVSPKSCQGHSRVPDAVQHSCGAPQIRDLCFPEGRRAPDQQRIAIARRRRA
jgi:hypothetical protein